MNLTEKQKSRFFDKIVAVGDCWEWQGCRRATGYGKVKVQNKDWNAHRLSYVLHKGNIPDGLIVCHKCDNPSCVNPAHLFLGTHQDNMDDKVRKNRQRNQHDNKTHCVHGHRFTEDNTAIRKVGGRICIACRRINRNNKYKRTGT